MPRVAPPKGAQPMLKSVRLVDPDGPFHSPRARVLPGIHWSSEKDMHGAKTYSFSQRESDFPNGVGGIPHVRTAEAQAEITQAISRHQRSAGAQVKKCVLGPKNIAYQKQHFRKPRRPITSFWSSFGVGWGKGKGNHYT